MALMFCDSFDAYSSSADLAKKWAAVGSGWVWSAGAGKFGGGAAYNAGASGSGNLLSTPQRLTQNENGIGFYAKFSAAPSSTLPFLRLFDASSNAHYSLRLNSSGNVLAYSGSDGNLRVTSAVSVADGAYHWIEVRFAYSNNLILYIDNVLQGSGSAGLDGAVGYLSFLSVSGVAITIDDLIVYDTTTGSPTTTSNFPLGARQITVLRPTSDAAVGFATTSSGSTHYNLVNETSPDGDTSYVEDGTSGDQDLYGLSSLSASTTITAVMLNTYWDNPYGGTINAYGICKSSSTQSAGTSTAVPLIYATNQWSFPVDPNTSAAWTLSGLNSAAFGYRNA